MELLEISKEYRENMKKIEQRITEITDTLENTKGAEIRRKLKERIFALQRLVDEGYSIIVYLENYYERE